MSIWDSYQVANRVKLANHWIQVLLILSLILSLNYLAMQVFFRFDLTENHRYALSPETKAYLNDLSEPIKIYVTIPRSSSLAEEETLYRYVSQLLQEYVYNSRNEGNFLIDVEYVDVFKDLAKADRLAREYGMEEANTLLIVANDRQRIIRPDEILEFSGLKPTSFKGESTLTSAIMEVTQEVSPTIYFLQGHQEASPNETAPSDGLSQITNELKLRNYSIRTIDLTTVNKVPDDAAMLIIADPKGPLLVSELDILRQWLDEEAGRLMAWIRPGVATNLLPLVSNWGIQLTDQVVVEPDPSYRESKGTLLIRNLGEHPITQSLIDNQTFLLTRWSRPIYPVAPDPVDERLHFQPLFATSSNSWAESTYRADADPSFDEGSDFRGPVPIAVAAERKASSQLGIKVPGGRLVVFGSPDLFSNQNIASLGNVTLFFNTLNWMLDRDSYLVIPPRPIDSYQLAVSQDQLNRIALLFLSLPAGIALIGFLVYWVRQS